MEPKNILSNAEPEIALQWHPEKNGDLTPNIISKWSVKKVWWLCEKGHEWEAYINNRTKRKDGCPFCSGRYATAEESLLTLFPEVSKDWHPTKNKDLTPDKVLPNSNIKAWWVCSRNSEHEWQSMIGSKVRSTAESRGCPYCAGKKASKDYNLEKSHPELANEWDFEKNIKLPSNYTPASNKKVWWKCSVCEFNWESSINNRTSRGCPKCSRGFQSSYPEQVIYYYLKQYFNKVINGKKINYLGQVYTIDIYIEDLNLVIEYDGEYAHKNKEERDYKKSDAIIANNIKLIRIREPRLPILISEGFEIIYRNSTSGNKTLYEVLIKLFNLIAKNYNLNSKSFFSVLDEHIDSIELKISEKLKIDRKENSLAITHPNIASQWDMDKNLSLSPNNYTKNSSKNVWWRCEFGHSYQYKIVNKSEECLVCVDLIVTKDNCIANKHKHLLQEWNYNKNYEITPEGVSIKSRKVVWWKCNTCNFEYQATVQQKGQDYKCPSCTNQVVTQDNCLATNYPEIASEWNYNKNGDLTPFDLTPGSDKKVWWKCNVCSNEWETAVYHRKKTGCPKCAFKKMGDRFRKTTEQFKKELFEIVGDEYGVLEEYRGAQQRIKFIHHVCGTEFITTPSKLKTGHKRCRCKKEM